MVRAHVGEADHEPRRSQLAVAIYALPQSDVVHGAPATSAFGRVAWLTAQSST